MFMLRSLFSRARTALRLPVSSPEVERLREAFDAASPVAVIAGSGLSAASGLPVQSGVPGIGSDAPPLRYRHFLIDEATRLEQWRRSLAEAEAFSAAAPNRGHAALASLARTRRLKVVTGTVDGLLARAGLHRDDLVELRGRGDLAVCTQCGLETPISDHVGAVADGYSPRCERDGAILKPGAALFGETPARSTALRSEEIVRTCKLLLVAGSSLSSPQESGLVEEARHAGARIAIVNNGPLVRDVSPDLLVEADAVEVLAALAA